MSVIIGIDAGISSTKIIGIENGKRILEPITVTSNHVVSAIYGALGKYLVDNNGLSLNEIEHVMITGVGASNLSIPIHNCPTSYVDEFKANGMGARFDSGLDHMIVVSMGTGTSLVRVDGDDIQHIGGIGMGGGTLQGLSHLMLNTTNIEKVDSLAMLGYLSNINLTIKDICDGEVDSLNEDSTAALFGDVTNHSPDDNDIAAGIIYMVLETIGSAAVLSQLNSGFKDFVLIGGLTKLFMCQNVFTKMEELYGVHFHIPKYAPYCTALGAALSYKYENE